MKTKAELRKRFWALLLTASLLLSLIPVQALAANGTESPLDSFGTLLTDLGSLQISKNSNADGGCAEIVRYNPDNRSYYVVDGVDKQLSIVNLNSLKDSKSENTGLAKTKTINFSDMAKYIPGFTFGDLTSVAIDTNRDLVAVAVQEQDYTKNGAVVLLDYDGNYIKYFPTGVQPDMVCFSPDSNYILTADEGEPRGGYAAGTTDPKGSVTLINISCGITEAAGKTVTFDLFDAQRAQLVTDNVILKKGASPSADLEPEYIAVSGDKAYVTCQEANAIATLDLKTARFTSVKGLGFQDFGNVPVDVLKSDSAGIKDSANPELQPNLRGIYMPDGIAAYQAGGKTYLLTANEGDSRSWPSYSNEKRVSFKSGYKKLTCLDTSDYDGNFEAGKSYLFGGRSVSVWDADTMKQIADTGSDFETITAKANPAHFNCSNDDVEADSRSNKKGPEAEFVTTGAVDGKPYAFIGLERIGGVLAYDISSITAPKPVDYLNTRDFSAPVAGDDSPEGLDFVPAADSPSGYPLLLAANEVSGTVSMIKVGDTRYTQNRTVTIFHTNDMHGSLVTSSGSVGADYVSAMKKSVPGSLLIDAGDATQGSSFATLTQGKDVIRLMNAAGYDAMASGNHEFDYGQDPMLKNAQAAEFPIVAANVLKNGAPFLKGNSYCGGRLINNGRYQIEYAQGLKIGIFGITTPETATKTNPVGIQGIDFGKNETSAVAATVQSQIDTLKNTEKCDLVIGAMHIGDDPSSDVTAKAIVAKVQGLDLLIDGHSHETEQISNISGTDGKTISVVQTGSSSKNIGKVQISWDGSKAANVTTKLITAAAVKSIYTASPFITQMASMIAGAQADQLKPVIGTTKTTLWGGTVNGINEARLAETNLGSLVADSMVWQAKQLIKDGAYKDLPVVALQNGGGVRAVIKAGNVTVGDALNVLPFGNTLAFKEITPAVLYSALENGVSGVISQDAATGKITGAAGSFPQVSGYKFTYDPRKAKGSRVTSLILENGTVLQRSDTSTKLVLASNDFELAGGDGYTMLIGLTSVGEGGTLDTVLESYIKSIGTVNMPIISGRITCDGGYAPKSYDASVTVNKDGAPVKSTAVNYQVDGGTVLSVTTDGSGLAKLPGLKNGPHAVKIGDADNVLVNNYSGAGISAKVAASVKTTVRIDGGSQDSDSGSNNHHNSGGSKTSNTPGTPASASTILTSTNSSNGVLAMVSTQPDTAPVVTGNRSAVNVTVPFDATSVISSATAERPAEIRVAAPTAAILSELKNSAVNAVDLTMQMPSSIANNTNANARVSINVEPAVLQAAKDAQKDLTLRVTDSQTGALAYSWTFSGSGLKNSAAPVSGLNLAVTVESTAKDAPAAAAAANNAADKKPAGLVLKFGSNGLLPAPATVKIYVGGQNGITPNSKVYFYYFNNTTNALEQLPQSEYTVDADGYVTLSITHCSEYVLLPKAATNPYPVKSDTACLVGVKNGKTYTFAMTVTGNANPVFTVGNAKAFACTVKKQGGKYYVTVKAVGAPGLTTAVYAALPKQKPVAMGYIRTV